jgi:HSP20 family protein
MTLRNRYGSFSNALSLRNAMDQLLEQSFVSPSWGWQNTENMAAAMNVCETDHGYQVEVAMPGVKPEDIDVTVHQNTLSIKGSYKYQQGQPQNQQGQNQQGQGQNQQGQQNWLVQELRSGTFERTITFPKPIDAEKITTHYEHGILTIDVPLSPSSQPKKISVKSAQGSQSQQQTAEAQKQ